MNSQDLVNRIQNKTPAQFPELLKRSLDRVAEIVPRHVHPDRLMRIALVCYRNNPRLGQCDSLSVLSAVLQAAQLGLEPGLSGEAHLVPYGKECQLIPGYQGLVKLALNSGKVTSIDTQVVYEADEFEIQLGIDVELKHKPYLDGPRGALRLVYGIARLKDNREPIIDFMTKDQIYAARNHSSGYKTAIKYGKDNPWVGDFESEMWRKTMTKRLIKRLPQSAELQTAIELENIVDNGRSQGLSIEAAARNVWVPIDEPPQPQSDESNKPKRGRPPKDKSGKGAVNEANLLEEIANEPIIDDISREIIPGKPDDKESIPF